MQTRPMKARWPWEWHSAARAFVAGTWMVAKYDAQVVPWKRVRVMT